MSSKLKWFLIALVIIIIASILFLFTIKEGQSGLDLRLGRLVSTGKPPKAKIYQPGLHFKLPFVDSIRKFDTRLQTLDIESSRIVTAEKKDVIVDYYVKWRISDLPLYYKRTGGDAERAGILLKQQLNDSLRAQFGRRSIREVVSDDRASIMRALNEKANQSAQRLGLDVIDVRIKRIDLPPKVSESVFDRMRAEREQVAKEHRSEGKAEAEALRAEAEGKATVIVATAQSQANLLRAQGDEQSAKIYAQAYQKNPEFYAFLRSLQAYSAVFASKDDMLVLTPDSQFFKYFNSAGGQSTAAKAP